MIITQRQAVLGMLGFQMVGAGVLLIITLVTGQPATQSITTAVVMALYGALLAAYIKGWDPARYINAVAMVLSVGIPIAEPYITQQFAIQIIIVPMIILIITDWMWALGSVIVLFGMILFKAGGTGIYTDPQVLLLCGVIILVIGLLWKLSESNERRALLGAQAADEARMRAEHDQQIAEQRSAELHKINIEQESLLAIISQLEIPAIQVAEGVLIAPLIGNIDTRRAHEITRRLLDIAHTRHVQLVILDVTGLAMIDTTIAQRLVKAAQSLQLLGCQVTISGVSAQVAISLAQIGIALSDTVHTSRTPQDALEQFLVIQRGGATDPTRLN